MLFVIQKNGLKFNLASKRWLRSRRCNFPRQVSALLWHPEPHHKLRPVWAFLHHWLGRIIVALSILNIYFGLHLLKPKKAYTIAYTVIILAIGGAAVLLEARLQFGNGKATGKAPRASTKEVESEKGPHTEPQAV